eukprot:TRINITY_DN124988_c0_g1_i1.p1 TRINITY_DN124988_c0_g1~~TRINITY_DN124988_c0_g1_i1.p1  ORF type:complete len:230 (+),score=18.74 TRINITY_DN124988_c0_g1_i1:3-692(+)
MELLQGIQYIFIDDCDNKWNQILTYVGLLHIVCQPFFCNLIHSGIAKDEKIKQRYTIVLRLCVLGGLWLAMRIVLGHFYGWNDDLTQNGQSFEWVRGVNVCTFSGKYHLAWSVPMYESSYLVPGVAIHSFLMFGPVLVIDDLFTTFSGIFLFLTGPFMASLITDNLHEQASVWCFFSISQLIIIVVTFLLKVHLIADEEEKRYYAKWMPRKLKYNLRFPEEFEDKQKTK